jgi:hypothetical protein
MKNTSLTRSIPYWILVVVALVTTVLGGWLVWDNTSTMQRTLLDGTATNVEVYVGQAWITGGSAILAAGVVGVLLALGLAAAKALIPASAPVVVEPIDWTTQDDEPVESIPEPVEGSTGDELSDDQNGSSGSTATATKISVK